MAAPAAGYPVAGYPVLSAAPSLLAREDANVGLVEIHADAEYLCRPVHYGGRMDDGGSVNGIVRIANASAAA